MILNRDNILSAKPYTVHKVEVPKWGGEVCVRSFSAKLKDKIEQMQLDGKDKGSLRAVSVVGCLCDEEGKLILSEDDLGAVEDMDVETVDTILGKIFEISQISEKDIDKAAKN